MEKIVLYDHFGKTSNAYFINNEKQKDSIEEIYFFGKLTKKIFWTEGAIDSIVNYHRVSGNYSGNEIIKDSAIFTYNVKNQLIQKSGVDKNGRYQGMSIKYDDSLINRVARLNDKGIIEGVFSYFDKNEYPTLIGISIENKLPLAIKFHKSGVVKELIIKDENDMFGVNIEYHLDGKIKNKIEYGNASN